MGNNPGKNDAEGNGGLAPDDDEVGGQRPFFPSSAGRPSANLQARPHSIILKIYTEKDTQKTDRSINLLTDMSSVLVD